MDANNKTDKGSSEEGKPDPTNQYLELGQGVKRSTPKEEPSSDAREETKKEIPKEEEPPPPPLGKDEGEWCDYPTYDDQYSKYPQTTRSRGPHYTVFDLSDTASTLALNALMDKQYPDTAPRIVLADTTKQYSEKTDNWKVMVSYYTLQYRKLLLGKVPPP